MKAFHCRRLLSVGLAIALVVSIFLLFVVSSMNELEEPIAMRVSVFHRTTLPLSREGNVFNKLSSTPRMSTVQKKSTLSEQIQLNISRLWPSGDEDRILRQLAFKIETKSTINIHATDRTNMIGKNVFETDNCTVRDCAVTSLGKADVIIERLNFNAHRHVATANGPIIGMYMLEAPSSSRWKINPSSRINWTLTYRKDSTIVTPYEKFVLFPPGTSETRRTVERNYAKGKTKMAAAFVSNCHAQNGRMGYIEELQKHISVHVYGACGTHRCPKSRDGHCFDMLSTDYKFYLAFENANCADYITEKFYVNALQ